MTINKRKDNVHDDDHYWGAARWKTQRVAEHSLVGTLLFHCWLSIPGDSGDEDFQGPPINYLDRKRGDGEEGRQNH